MRRGLEHPRRARSSHRLLIQGSAGYVEGALAGRQAEVAYLGIGQLGKQDAAYMEAYWEHTVRAVGARRVVLIHWDDFFRPSTSPSARSPTSATTSTPRCGC